MRTTLDLDQGSYRLVKAVSAQRGISMGKFVAEAVRAYCGHSEEPDFEITYNEIGWPTISVGHPVTPQDVADAINED